MNSPPAGGPSGTNTSGLTPKGQQKATTGKNKVLVVNPLQGSRRMRRKDAEYYVTQGRAVWQDGAKNQLRLVMAHPANEAAVLRAAAEWEALIPPDPTATKLSHAIACFPQKFKGLEHRASRFIPPMKPVVHVPGSDRVPDGLCKPDRPKAQSLRNTTVGARVAADLRFKLPLTKKDLAAMKDAVG